MAGRGQGSPDRSGGSVRVLAGVLVVLAGLAVFLWGVYRNPEPASTGDAAPGGLKVVSQVPVAGSEADRDARPPELPDHEAGPTYYVDQAAAEQGTGSWNRPWADLQQSLCRLRPGDRLAIVSGTYEAPVAVAGDCVDGSPRQPIVVVAAGEVTLRGPDTRRPVDRPTLTLARSHWRIRGLKIEPQWSRPGILVSSGTVDVELSDLHMLKGIGDGVRVAHGAGDITIANAHLHHLGTLRGAQRNFRDPDTAAILIAPGTTRITVSGVVIHHMEGDAVQIVSPDRYEAQAGLPEARDVVVENVASRMLFGEWD